MLGARLAAVMCLAAAAVAAADHPCARCHAAIVARYAKTGMAKTSGAVASLPVSALGGTGGGTVEAANGIRYEIARQPGGALAMRFERLGVAAMRGERPLEWFLGSGGLGRSFLFSRDGFLYQAPVSFYASSRKWQVSPGYENRPAMDLTRGVEAACLQCHASSLQPVPHTQNRFASPPFAAAGVSCERCHGDGAAHAASARPADVVNPRKLAAEERDSVCAQCHLTGAARVARAAGGGGAAAAYRPGDRLSATVAVFLWEGGGSGGGAANATSHYERLNASACKKASGEKLWCGTCHDVHGAGTTSFRAQCLSCHKTGACKAALAARKAAADNCISCHMPKGESRMVEHVAFTDHAIPRRPAAVAAGAAAAGARTALVPYWPGSATPRDQALAYSVAAMTEPAVRRPALALLEAAAAESPQDVPILAQLAQFYDRLQREEQAEKLYERVLALDASHIAAAANLGIFRAKRGDVAEAMRLWRRALAGNPALTGTRVNLAVALARQGDRPAAIAELETALQWDPDASAPRKLLAELGGGGAVR